MSRYGGTSSLVPRKGPHWSHLRHSSRSSVDRTSAGPPASITSVSTHSTVKEDARTRTERRATVSVNEGYSKDEVLLNLDLVGGDVKPGSLMCLTVLKDDLKKSSMSHGSGNKTIQDQNGSAKPEIDPNSLGKRYVFVVKDLSADLKARNPEMEVYVVKHIADAFGMKKGSQVLLTSVW